jgi:hypothetical protein
MAQTRNQVIDRALRMLGVLAEDIEASTAQRAIASEVLEGILWETRTEAFAAGFGPDRFPDEIVGPLSALLAVDLAPQYPLVAPPMPRHRAVSRIMAIVRPDDRFVRPFTGQWGIEQIDPTAVGYERTAAIGRLVPMMPHVREVSAKTDTNVVRIRTDGRSKINGMDRLRIRLSSWQEPETILTWDDATRDYSRVDAPLTAWIAGRLGLTTQLTISDAAMPEDMAEGPVYF